MPADIKNIGPKVFDADLDAFEKRLDHPIPESYRNFLLKFNGGSPEFHIIRGRDIQDMRIQLFYGLRDDEYFDIDTINAHMQGRWPARFLAVAIDGFGNRFLLSLEMPDYGKVYLWDHEQEAEEGHPPTEDNLYIVANSFAEFWYLLEPLDAKEYLKNEGHRGSEPDSE